ISEFFIPSIQSVNLKSIQIKEPGNGSTAHSSAPAMHDSAARSAFAQFFFNSADDRSHLRPKIIQPDFYGLLPAFLLIGRAHFFALLIRKQRNRERSGIMCMMIL